MIGTPFVYDIAMAVGFRGITRRSGVLLEGPAGWSEWSPFPEYDDQEAAPWLAAALECAGAGYPAPVRDVVPINGIVPALDPTSAAQRALASGCQTIKVKVAGPGTDLDADVARVTAVREALPTARLRVDANGGWDLATATAALERLRPLGLEYAEQPCATVEDLARLRARDLGIAIAADESIRRASDPLRVRDAGAADVAILKVAPIGGINACLRLAAELGMPVVVSSAVETSVGLRAGVALAAALPELPFACGLETGRLLSGDVTADPLIPVGGGIAVRDVRLDQRLLEAHRAADDLRDWWLARLARVTAIVEEGR